VATFERLPQPVCRGLGVSWSSDAAIGIAHEIAQSGQTAGFSRFGKNGHRGLGIAAAPEAIFDTDAETI
jgi:hypothetical protein